MTDLELILNMLAEATTTQLSQIEKPATFAGSIGVAREGGAVAKNARLDIESRTGRSVVTALNAKDKPALEISANNDASDDDE